MLLCGHEPASIAHLHSVAEHHPVPAEILANASYLTGLGDHVGPFQLNYCIRFCSVLLCSALLYSALFCSTLLYYVLFYSALLCPTLIFITEPPYSAQQWIPFSECFARCLELRPLPQRGVAHHGVAGVGSKQSIPCLYPEQQNHRAKEERRQDSRAGLYLHGSPATLVWD